MANEIQAHNQQGSSLEISDKATRIAKVIVDVNDCVPFKLPKEDILYWATELERLCDDKELHKLSFLMDCFKTDAIVWDQRKGIQNLFNGLRKIAKNEEGHYIILKEIW